MIHCGKKVALELRWVVILLFLVSAMMAPVRVDAQWDQLSQAEQQQVLDQLKTRLSGILSPGPAKDDLDYILTYGRGWSQLAGALSEGDTDTAVRSTLELGEGHLLTSLQEELNLQVGGMGLSETTQGIYAYVRDNSLFTKELAIEMFQGKWEGARKLVLEHARTKAVEAAEANFTQAYNWVFDNRSVGAVTPAVVFLYLVRAEMDLVPKWAAQREDAKLQEMFEIYRERGRDWESFQSDGSDVGYTSKAGGGIATWQYRQGELQALFESCSKDLIATCITDAERKVKRENDAIARSLKKISQQRSDALHSELEKLTIEINRLAAEFDEEFKNAFGEAQSIAKEIKGIGEGARVECGAFAAALDKVEAALQKVTDAESSVATVQGFNNKGEDCASLKEDRKKLSRDLDRLTRLKTDFDTSLSQVETAARAVCAASGEVSRATSRTEGRTFLDTAVQRGRYLRTLVRTIEDMAADIRSGNADIATAIKAKKAELEQLISSVSDTTAVEAAFTAIEAAKGARQEFDAARSVMQQAVNRLDGLTNEFERVNPVEPGLMDRLSGLLSGGYNRDEKRRMLNLLSKYRDYPGVDELVAIHADSLSALACADTVHRQWDNSGSLTGRWSFRQWREPNIPASLRTDYQMALRQCADLPASSELGGIADQASRLTEQMEIREVELWVHKNDADECVAEAIVAYNNLPGDQADTSATALIEQAEGKIATAHASETAFNDVKGKLDAVVSKYTAALAGLRESNLWWQSANTRIGRGIDALKQEMARTVEGMRRLQSGYQRLADFGLQLRGLANQICAASTAPSDRIAAWRSSLQDLTAEVGAAAEDTDGQFLQYRLDKVKTARQNLNGEAQAVRLKSLVIDGQGNRVVKEATAILAHRKQLGTLAEEIASLKTQALGLLDQAEAARAGAAPDQGADLASRIQAARASANALGAGLSIPSYGALGMDTVPDPNAARTQVGGFLSTIDGRLKVVEKSLAEARALPGEVESIRVAGEFAVRTVPEHLARATTCLAGIAPESPTTVAKTDGATGGATGGTSGGTTGGTTGGTDGGATGDTAGSRGVGTGEAVGGAIGSAVDGAVGEGAAAGVAGVGDEYDPFADPNLGGGQPSPTQISRAQAAGAEAWKPGPGVGGAVGTVADTVAGGQAIGCEYSGTCGGETSGGTQSESVVSAAGSGSSSDDWGDEFDPDNVIPGSPRSEEPPAGGDTEPAPSTGAGTATTQPPPTTQPTPKDQGKREPLRQPTPPAPQPTKPPPVVSCCALTGDISVPEKKYIVSTSTQVVSKGGVRGSPDCSSLTSVSVVSVDGDLANQAASKLRSTGNKQVQIFGSESAALSRAGSLCRKAVWDNMKRPVEKPKDEQQCAQLKNWWKLARCDEVLLRNPDDPRYSTPSGGGGAAYAPCKRSLPNKTTCENAGLW